MHYTQVKVCMRGEVEKKRCFLVSFAKHLSNSTEAVNLSYHMIWNTPSPSKMAFMT
uniref:Uncharacterized protein n=1 Tax=Nelumbo nucifera TaxID=4432 RepID=A0A822XIZ4_NELNU|nr:TPA_asm: hypothetical protein HUJ06_021435 [Nelumbo nucifera]